MGGVGLAVSSRCAEKELAVDFVQFTASAEIQKGIYYHNAGQPGYLGAWTDATINASCNQFFADTLDTLRHSYLRPRYEGYNEFQEKAGLLLNAGLKERDTPKEIDGKDGTIISTSEKKRWLKMGEMLLEGLRVIDLSHHMAGPVASQAVGGYGRGCD